MRAKERRRSEKKRRKKLPIRIPFFFPHLVHVLGPNRPRDGGGDCGDAAPAVLALAGGAEHAQRVEKLLLFGGLPLLSFPFRLCEREREKEKKGFAKLRDFDGE